MSNEYLSQLKSYIQLKKDMVNNKRDKIRVLERNIELNEEEIIRFKIENDILVDEIKFLNKRRKENE